MNQPKRVLILCTGNSARSQMAEGILRTDGGEKYEVLSAGMNPGFVRPEAVLVMKEIGIDISDARSKSVEEFDGQEFDYVITVCDNAKAEELHLCTRRCCHLRSRLQQKRQRRSSD